MVVSSSTGRKEGEGTFITPFENLPQPQWSALIDKLYLDHPEGGSGGLLPPHFLKSTFPKIGGQIAHLSEGDADFWGLILPHPDQDGHTWILRAYWRRADTACRNRVENSLTTQLYDLSFGSGTWYNVEQQRDNYFTGEQLKNYGIYSIGTPNRAQALEAQRLHEQIWKVKDPAYLYPFDLYRPDSGLPTRLVATVNSKVVGFLFGFYAHGHQWVGHDEANSVWIESQLLGVKENHRRQGLGKQLKFLQRELALQEHIPLIHWTVDPLQAGNAFLNLNELGGIAVHFYLNYYPFQNELNRVPASRIGVSWFLSSDRVKAAVAGKLHQLDYLTLRQDVNTDVIFPLDTSSKTPKGKTILIQIPNHWTEMQNQNKPLAAVWRQATDAIFTKILGTGDDKFALTGIVRNPQKNEVFLVAQRSPRNFI
jgi:predicted GNAT superfamily acetyltransferase